MAVVNKIPKSTILKKIIRRTEWRSTQPLDEMSKAIEELSPDAFRMLAYMYTKSDNWVFSNTSMQKALGIAESTVKKKLKELKDKRYFHEAKGEITIYLIGLNAVEDYTGVVR